MMDLKLLELAAITVSLDKEEGVERKRRRWAVHPAWSKREIKGEFVILYKELIEDEVKILRVFSDEQRMFFALLEKVGPLLTKKMNKISKASIT